MLKSLNNKQLIPYTAQNGHPLTHRQSSQVTISRNNNQRIFNNNCYVKDAHSYGYCAEQNHNFNVYSDKRSLVSPELNGLGLLINVYA